MDTYVPDDTATARRKKRRRALLAILLSSSLATLGAGSLSLAVFTDTDATGGSWTAGTVVLGVSPTTAFSATAVMPGDSGIQTITVSNTGTGALRYAVSSSATNADGKGLAAQMDVTIKAGTCASAGATLYSGKLDAVALGSSAQGAEAGDRSVAAGASDSLCFGWSLDLGTGNSFQGAATTATFTFDAEQTANN